jgi:hypothetical protein
MPTRKVSDALRASIGSDETTVLARRMASTDPRGTDWSDRDVDLIVADYFVMLRMELAGQRFVKSHRNAALQELTGRSRQSIEYKHANISAVLERLGFPTIFGYKPRRKFQGALIDGVARYLASNDGVTFQILAQDYDDEPSDALIFEAPPLHIVEPPAPPQLNRLVRKYDPAERDARNRALGVKGEERVLFAERHRLLSINREDLARKIRWVAQEDGDGAGYDIKSFEANGAERLIEVKTTVGSARTPFYLSRNELAFSEERPEAFKLVRLYDFARTPKAFEMVPPLSGHVHLQPITYQASF